MSHWPFPPFDVVLTRHSFWHHLSQNALWLSKAKS